MQSLADMGRLFNDEDEARMVKLTEDLDAWINKYATTFEDPEEILFEVSSSLMTDEMEAKPETKTAEPADEIIEEPVDPVPEQ